GSASNDYALLEAELDNLRAALGWCVARNELAIGVRIFWPVREYLYSRGRGQEEDAWRRRLLALPEAAQPSVSRARLLAVFPLAVGRSSAEQAHAATAMQESVALSRRLGDTQCLAAALRLLGDLRLMQGDY